MWHPLRYLTRIALVLTLAVARPVAAHDFWIEPSTFLAGHSSVVQVNLRVGEGFRGDPVPRIPQLIERFFLQGREAYPVPGLDGRDPAGVVRVPEEVPYWIGYQSKASFVELAAEKFERYLNEEGLDRIVQMRARLGTSGLPGKEAFFRSAKALLCPGRGSTAGSGHEIGLTVELIPEKDLCSAHPGDLVPFQLRYRGEPLAGSRVTAFTRAEPDQRIEARTDDRGRVRLVLPRAGTWLVKTVHMVPAETTEGVDWESFWAALTFELRQ